MRSRRLACLLAAWLMLHAAPAVSQPRTDEEPARDLIHSDLPLFAGGGADAWPRPFHDGDSFGCASRVAFGDWALAERDDEPEWVAIRNYGVFHCWALIGRAQTQEELESAEFRPAFFVRLGAVRGGETELWAIQIGARPGSDYMLLARPAGEGAIETFSVLQTQCPRSKVRDAGTLAILLTRYCAINTRADLLRLARRMAEWPPLGALSLVRSDADEP